MKLDRQEVIGATVALEQWVNMNHEDRINEYVTKQETIKNIIGSVNGITAEIVEIPTFHGYSLKVSVDPSVSSVDKLVDELANGSPRIMVAPPEDPNAHLKLKKSDITASGYGTQKDTHPHFMIGVTEINDDHVKQIGDRIKEILS
jgi:seryl-tRNA(Sec) selenium transferase